MKLTPEETNEAIDAIDYPVTYFHNGFGFDPKDTLRRFAGEVLRIASDKLERILSNADEARTDAEIVSAVKAMMSFTPIPPGVTVMPSSYTLETAIEDTSIQHHADDVLAFLNKLKSMIKPYTIETDRDGYILEGAMQHGFDTIDDDGSLYVVSAGDLMAYVKLYRDFKPVDKVLISREALNAMMADPVIKNRVVEILDGPKAVPGIPHPAACPTMDDDEFIGYCAIHSTTERALFTGAQINRLRTLAGEATANIPHNSWFSVPSEAARLATKARALLKK